MYAGNEKLFDLFSQWVDLMEAYATQAAIAIQNAQLSAQLRDKRTTLSTARKRCGTSWRVIAVVQSGRARWKTKNENHNTHKHRGYHLEHNFGHGRQLLASFLLSLNLLACLLHTVLDLTEPKVKQLRVALATRMTFFNDLRTLTHYFYFQSWEQLLDFMLTHLELQSSP